MEKQCEMCKKKYQAKRNNQKYCSVECQYGSYRKPKVEKKERVCLQCGVIFLKIPSKSNEKNGKYCSRKCKDIHQKEIYIGEKNPTWGRKSSLYEKEFRINLIKELWKSQEFRESVRKGQEKFLLENGYWPGSDENSKEKRKKTMFDKYGITHNWNGKYGERKCDLKTFEIYGKDPIRIMFDLPNLTSNTKPEKIFKSILDELKILYEPQYFIYYENKKYKIYDFFLKEKNILVEIDGDYWHGNPSIFKNLNEQQLLTQKNDFFKNELAIKNCYKILRFWENDLKKNKDFIKQKIMNL